MTTHISLRNDCRPTWTSARVALVLATALALLATLTVAPAAAQDRPDLAGQFVDSVNAERAQRGLPRLHVAGDLNQVAARHSVRMADQRHLHHNPNLTSDVRDWRRVSENVGRGRSVTTLHRAFMNSDGHRRNILDTQVTQIGVGVEVRDGTVWVTKVFRRPSTASAPRFSDVRSGNTHRANIDRIAQAGVAAGCRVDRFCPTSSVTRAQMATFLGRAAALLPAEVGPFADLGTAGHHNGNVNSASAAGIVTACADGRFCPDRALTRAEMAEFLGLALGLEPKPLRDFTDVSADAPYAGWVQALADRGVTGGCAAGRYCPDEPVSRQQMASFLVRAFGL